MPAEEQPARPTRSAAGPRSCGNRRLRNIPQHARPRRPATTSRRPRPDAPLMSCQLSVCHAFDTYRRASRHGLIFFFLFFFYFLLSLLFFYFFFLLFLFFFFFVFFFVFIFFFSFGSFVSSFSLFFSSCSEYLTEFPFSESLVAEGLQRCGNGVAAAEEDEDEAATARSIDRFVGACETSFPVIFRFIPASLRSFQG